MPKTGIRTGGQRVAYPGKERKSINLQLTKTASAILDDVKTVQLERNFKVVNRKPSTGDVFEAYLRKVGTKITLPKPTRA